LDTFWKEIGEIENSFGYSSDSDIKKKFKKNLNNYPRYNKYNSDKLTNSNIKQSSINREKNNLKWYKNDSIQNQFKSYNTLNTLNLQHHLNIENQMPSKIHICYTPDSISKRQCIRDLRPSTENGKLVKSVNQITQTEKLNNYFEKSKNELVKH